MAKRKGKRGCEVGDASREANQIVTQACPDIERHAVGATVDAAGKSSGEPGASRCQGDTGTEQQQQQQQQRDSPSGRKNSDKKKRKKRKLTADVQRRSEESMMGAAQEKQGCSLGRKSSGQKKRKKKITEEDRGGSEAGFPPSSRSSHSSRGREGYSEGVGGEDSGGAWLTKKIKTARKSREGGSKVIETTDVGGSLISGKAPAAEASEAEAEAAQTAAMTGSRLSCTSKAAEYNAASTIVSAGAIGRNVGGPTTDGTRKEKGRKKRDNSTSQQSAEEHEKKQRRRQNDKHQRKRASTSSPQTKPTQAISISSGTAEDETRGHGEADGDDGSGSSGALEGVMHQGAMYLVDSRKRVFSAERDAFGELVQVGVFDTGGGGDGVVLLTTVASDDHVAGAAAVTTKKGEEAMEAKETEQSRSNKKANKERKKKKKKKGSADDGQGGAEVVARSGGLSGGSGGGGAVETVQYPYEVEECDHCETSERAYADVAPLLAALAKELGKAPAELSIYDPYYCQGSTVARLASLGFPRVYNKKEDFYEVVRAGKIPEHDVVVTNPPFSGDHVPNILRFCARQAGKPWLLLLPNFVYLKDYFEPSLAGGQRAGRTPLDSFFFLTPAKRYAFHSPQGSRINVKSSERKTSPFNTFWYIHVGNSTSTSKILQGYNAWSRKVVAEERCCVARTSAQIPYKMMDSNDPRRKKARDRQRSIERIRKKKSEWMQC